jgi:formamidopyrimidine-DNA glycosylase
VPELPDVQIYLEALQSRLLHQRLERVRIRAPFLLRSVSPPISEAEGKTVTSLGRRGKRIVIGLERDLYLVLHLMIAGRLHWKARSKPGEPPPKLPGKVGLAALDFPSGSLVLTEAGSKRRASLHVVSGADGLRSFDRGGIEVLEAGMEEFRHALQKENHTLKRALTDPRLFSGIGNAYSDEILHRARLSPLQMTQRLAPDEIGRLYRASRDILTEWIDRLRQQSGHEFPEGVTAFRPEMAVHGRYRKPCPDCGSLIQRIRYADNETNYCARCQTGGRLLADRAMSRLLKEDWPRTLEEAEGC